jgi:ABC-type multidrug transport system ATPase subunit
MDEASLCDRVALIQEGKILDIDSPIGITRKFRKPLWAVKASKMYDVMLQLRKMKEVESCYPFGQEHHVVLQDQEQKASVEDQLKQAGYADVTLKPITAGIEDCFMDLMKTHQS